MPIQFRKSVARLVIKPVGKPLNDTEKLLYEVRKWITWVAIEAAPSEEYVLELFLNEPTVKDNHPEVAVEIPSP